MKIITSMKDYIPKIENIIDRKHPREVYKEAKRIAEKGIDDTAIKRRVDELISIDHKESMDLDDMYGVERLKNGGYMLKVAISDVSEFVKPLSVLDLEALKRGTSIYKKYSVNPMFHRILSEDKLSLNHNKNRFTLTVQIEYDADANEKQVFIYESITYNRKRFDYESFSENFENLDSPYHDLFDASYELAKKLYQKRMNKGAIDFDESDRRILDSSKYKKSKNIAQLIIQEAAISTNKAIAKNMQENNLDGLYRNHMPEYLGKTEIPKIMQRASYDEKMLGHYGLAEMNYTHFTSPIRRYADIIVHRIIKQNLRGEQPIYNQNSIKEITEYLNYTITNIIIGQKQDDFNNKIIKKYRNIGGNQILNESSKKGNFITHIDNHLYQNFALPEKIKKEIINTIKTEKKVASWIIQKFIYGTEADITKQLKIKLLNSGDYSRTINIINSIGKENTDLLGKIEIKEEKIESETEKGIIIGAIYLNGELFYSKRGKIYTTRITILRNLFDYFIKKNSKN